MVFLVIDETWKLFSQTGNIEAYLLLKELENQNSHQYTNEKGIASESEM